METCQVCLRLASDQYNHYGCFKVCHSCRVFFARSVKMFKFKNFKHKAPCQIDSTGKKSCKKCRFTKCLDIGMKVSYVSPGNSERAITQKFTNDEEMITLNRAYQRRDSVYDFLFDTYENNLEMAVRHTSPPPWSAKSFKEFKELHKAALKNNLTPDFDPKTANVLVNENYELIQNFNFALTFYVPKFKKTHEMFLDYAKTKRDQNRKIQFVVGLMEDGANCKTEYEDVFSSPWAESIDIEDEHQDISVRIGKWFASIGSERREFDFLLYFIICSILLTNCENIEMSEKKNIEQAQIQNTNLLLKYLKSKCETKTEAYTKFHNGLMIIHQARKLQELAQKSLNLEEVTLDDIILE